MSGWSLDAELVVIVVFDAGAGEITIERFEVLMRRARSSMQKQHLDAGVLPTRLVQTWKAPFGVCMGIIFTPPLTTSSRL
jgi:hypothetical protein